MLRRRGTAIAIGTLLACLGQPGWARADSAEGAGLDFLEPMIGPWVPHPDWPPLQKDPARRLVVYREHGAGGVALEGSLVRLGPTVVKRYYRAAHPDGSVQHREDTWRWEKRDADCFEWTTARVEGGVKTPGEPYWVCRREVTPPARASDRGGRR